jgi:hypothetical protein
MKREKAGCDEFAHKKAAYGFAQLVYCPGTSIGAN